MRRVDSTCVDCPSMGMPCKGLSCPNHGTYEIVSCDECGCEDEDIYLFEDEELCLYCIVKRLEKVS